MGRLFEQGSDVDPLLTHRVASGLVGNTTKNHTWSKILAWFGIQLKIETEQYIVNIGTWNMGSSTTINVAHGLADHTKILAVHIVIYPDTGTSIYLGSIVDNAGNAEIGAGEVDATNIEIKRYSTGVFNSGFTSTVINRGKIIIYSEPQ